jgi:hypothetical protein
MLKWLVVLVASLTLSGCGGGGGGAVPPSATLTGTITDTTLAPVEGATVRINNGAAFKTNAAGRYRITGLPGNKAINLTYAGPNAEYFPAAATVTLTLGRTTVLDLFLTRATGQTADANVGGTITSETFIDAASHAAYNLTANELTSGATPYTGNATVYLSPVDVSRPGHGLATFQATLGSFFAALAVDTAILETYGSTGLNITDPAGTALGLISTPTSSLTIPIPIALRAAPPATIDLWYLDEATGTWLSAGDTAVLDLGGESYSGVVSRPGLWRAAVEKTEAAGELTEITGTLQFSNGAPSAGTIIYLNGTDHGYQSIATTSSTGTFSLPGLTGGDFSLNFSVWANGAQWPHQLSIASLAAGNASLGNIMLPYAPPVPGGAARATITIDSRPAGAIAPDTLGYLLAAGRQISGAEDLLAAQNIADVTFLANDPAALFGAVTLTPTQAGAGIQRVANTFAGLTVAPAAGYVDQTDPDPANWTIANLETATLPVLVVVKTARGHYAKISIDSVTPYLGAWQVTFRHAFSLSGNF